VSEKLRQAALSEKLRQAAERKRALEDLLAHLARARATDWYQDALGFARAWRRGESTAVYEQRWVAQHGQQGAKANRMNRGSLA
jgi:hypothetical protein